MGLLTVGLYGFFDGIAHGGTVRLREDLCIAVQDIHARLRDVWNNWFQADSVSHKAGGLFVENIEADVRNVFDQRGAHFVGARTAKGPHLSRHFILIRKECRRMRSGVLHHVDRSTRVWHGLLACQIDESAAQTKTDEPSDERFGDVLHFLGSISKSIFNNVKARSYF